LFQESFENGLAGWAATGLWNAESATDTCGATQTPFPDGSGVAYYGIDGACDYQTGSSNSGAISWNGWVDLPVGAASIAVRFWSRSETEHCWQNWDVHRVFLLFETGSSNSGAISWNGWVDLPVGAASIAVRFWSRSETEHCWQNWDVHRVFLLFETGSSNSGAISWNGWVDLPVGAAAIAVRFWSRSETEHCWQNWDVHRVFLLFETGGSVPLQYCDGAQTLFDEPWHERRFDITQWGGQRVSLRFAFDSVDSGKNWLFGWMLDDVSIEVEPGGARVPRCRPDLRLPVHRFPDAPVVPGAAGRGRLPQLHEPIGCVAQRRAAERFRRHVDVACRAHAAQRVVHLEPVGLEPSVRRLRRRDPLRGRRDPQTGTTTGDERRRDLAARDGIDLGARPRAGRGRSALVPRPRSRRRELLHVGDVPCDGHAASHLDAVTHQGAPPN